MNAIIVKQNEKGGLMDIKFCNLKIDGLLFEAYGVGFWILAIGFILGAVYTRFNF